ncbi:MAG: sulfate adenylyltransferase subunit CysN [Ignavibacteriae bacterium]|nr:sulfate adenylyltransferase subunit CysN [Ignavibacteriota bacterium]NOG98617.1 sulfate adenylyltransferase subunit CysN [Ignavibacteriota bacterium]
MELLRFTTAGSVDDGKSTLIGRLLYDSKGIFEDQLEAVKRTSEKKGLENVDLALLTDGLRAEREQGITIDVAYRYFATPKRKFIIADTPGHVQYTRNMVTGASTANLALILVDARHGVVEQTKRHSYIASLLKIPHLVLCVNKMDLVDYEEERFDEIVNDFKGFAAKMDIKDVRFVPISALDGDNIVERSQNMDWYKGGTLLHLLETIHISSDYNHQDPRLPVQYVIRPQKIEGYHDYRGFAGRIASGIFRTGESVTVLPSGFSSKIKSIKNLNMDVKEAFPPMSISVELEDEIDISRGDMIVKPNNQPNMGQDIDAMMCWFDDKPLALGGKYILQHTSNEARAMVKDIVYKMDINHLNRDSEDKEIKTNDIFRVKLRTTKPLFYDGYKKNRVSGSIILIDENKNTTVAAGMIR